ncbi:hypothetical protein Tco_1214636 [Tanacetum coccineum]
MNWGLLSLLRCCWRLKSYSEKGVNLDTKVEKQGSSVSSQFGMKVLEFNLDEVDKIAKSVAPTKKLEAFLTKDVRACERRRACDCGPPSPDRKTRNVTFGHSYMG